MTDDEDDPYAIYSPESSDGGIDRWTAIALLIVCGMFFGMIFFALVT